MFEVSTPSLPRVVLRESVRLAAFELSVFAPLATALSHELPALETMDLMLAAALDTAVWLAVASALRVLEVAVGMVMLPSVV